MIHKIQLVEGAVDTISTNKKIKKVKVNYQLCEDINVSHRFITNATSGVIRYDLFKNEYLVSPEYIFN